MKPTHITIVGMGKVGTALYRSLSSIPEIKIDRVFYHTAEPEGVNVPVQQGLPLKTKLESEIYFLTVPDDFIGQVTNKLAGQHKDLSGKSFVHCSGTLSSNALNPLKEQGGATASFHPMKAVTADTHSFEDIWFDMEGDPDLLEQLEEMAQRLNAHTFRVTAEAKPYLHASAVVASNYMVVLADLLKAIAAKGDVSEELALNALSPLMQGTLDNIQKLGVTDSLTGPIARGDVDTIRRHLKALGTDVQLLQLYKTLGLQAVRIAERKNGNSTSLDEIKDLLK